MNRLKEKYLNEVVPSLMNKYNYKSKMEVPKLEKIVINIGVGDATSNSKLLDAAVADLTKLSGQKPVVTKAKKSIAGFKVREGQPIGCKVTLRGENMYVFLDKLISGFITVSFMFPTATATPPLSPIFSVNIAVFQKILPNLYTRFNS